MFIFAIPIVSTVVETIFTTVVTAIAAELASDLYHAFTAADKGESKE
jgi:hypothetical protein